MLNLGNPGLAFKAAEAAERRRRAGAHGIHHQRIHQGAPDGAGQPRQGRRRRWRDGKSRELVRGYARPADYFVQKLAEGIGLIAAAFHPKPVIVRLSDFKTNEYARLLGGEGFEPKEENPMLGFRGAARYAHPAYAAGFALECAALRRVRADMGLTQRRASWCRSAGASTRPGGCSRPWHGHGLKRGENGLEVYVMCEIPNNVISIDAFAKLFDGFSIGSNDLTQLTLGVDRDSEIVSFDFDERDPGMLEMLKLAVLGAKRNGKHVGICGEAPANYPEIAHYLAQLGIDSISVNPSSVLRTMQVVGEAETAGAAQHRKRAIPSGQRRVKHANKQP